MISAVIYSWNHGKILKIAKVTADIVLYCIFHEIHQFWWIFMDFDHATKIGWYLEMILFFRTLAIFKVDLGTYQEYGLMHIARPQKSAKQNSDQVSCRTKRYSSRSRQIHQFHVFSMISLILWRKWKFSTSKIEKWDFL